MTFRANEFCCGICQEWMFTTHLAFTFDTTDAIYGVCGDCATEGM